MAWNTADEFEDAIHAERLLRGDDGAEVGLIIRFYEDGPTYAHQGLKRLGAFSTDAAARHAVENDVTAVDGMERLTEIPDPE